MWSKPKTQSSHSDVWTEHRLCLSNRACEGENIYCKRKLFYFGDFWSTLCVHIHTVPLHYSCWINGFSIFAQSELFTHAAHFDIYSWADALINFAVWRVQFSHIEINKLFQHRCRRQKWGEMLSGHLVKKIYWLTFTRFKI